MLDKDYEDKSLKDILDASPALAGVTDADAAALAQAFNIKTDGPPARHEQVLRCCGGLGGLG